MSLVAVFCLGEANDQAKFFTCYWEAVQQMLELLYCMGGNASIINIEHVSDHNLSDISFCSQYGRVVKPPIGSCPQNDHIAKGMLKEHWEKIPKRVGARTPLHISNGFEQRLPSNCTVHFISWWKYLTKLRIFGGQPILENAKYSPSRLSVSNALVTSTKVR